MKHFILLLLFISVFCLNLKSEDITSSFGKSEKKNIEALLAGDASFIMPFLSDSVKIISGKNVEANNKSETKRFIEDFLIKNVPVPCYYDISNSFPIPISVIDNGTANSSYSKKSQITHLYIYPEINLVMFWNKENDEKYLIDKISILYSMGNTSPNYKLRTYTKLDSLLLAFITGDVDGLSVFMDEKISLKGYLLTKSYDKTPIEYDKTQAKIIFSEYFEKYKQPNLPWNQSVRTLREKDNLGIIFYMDTDKFSLSSKYIYFGVIFKDQDKLIIQEIDVLQPTTIPPHIK